MLLINFLKGIFSARSSGAHPRRNLKASHPNSADIPTILPPLTTPERDRIRNFVRPVFWGSTNPDALVTAAKEIVNVANPGYHFADNFLTWCRNMSMLDDQPFMQAWNANKETEADEAIIWRRYVLACAAYHCVQLEGDFVECGAYTGVGMKTVIDYLGGTEFPKTFWGFDMFEHDASMPIHSMPEHGPNLYQRVKDKFASYPQVKLIKGLIPQVFESDCPDQIAYLHIDLNQAPAEIAALEGLFDRMVPGGVLILDDYEWAGAYRPQKLAEDQWFDTRHYRVMPLPTGQGLVIKR